MENADKTDLSTVENQSGIQQPLGVPLVYTNGLAVNLTVTDIQIVATLNGRPQIILALPLSAGKSLSISLQKALADYERKTGESIPELHILNQQLTSNR